MVRAARLLALWRRWQVDDGSGPGVAKWQQGFPNGAREAPRDSWGFPGAVPSAQRDAQTNGRLRRLLMHLREGALVVRIVARAQRLDAGILCAVEGRHRRRTAGLRGV